MRSRIAITGGSGFVGRILQVGLRGLGYDVAVFDRLQGPLVDRLRYRTLGTSTSRLGRAVAARLRRAQSLTESLLTAAGAIRPTSDDVLGPRQALVESFRGKDAVIHLAPIPQSEVPGMTDADYWRVNYDGSVNVFEAAREAGVRKFLFASSGQVYSINKPVRIDQFPILETNYLPTLADGVKLYGFLKGEFERYLKKACSGSRIQAIALRLEFPGVSSRFAWNLYVSTSVENMVAGFVRALETDLSTEFDVFNLADQDVDRGIVDIQTFLKRCWPSVPNRTSGNQGLLGTEKARRLLGYDPKPGGTYFSVGVMW